MAYTIDLSIAIASDRSTATTIDNTVFGNGNPPREDVLVFLSGYKMTYENAVAETLDTTPDATPDTVSQWSWDYPTDGWFKFYYVIVKEAYDSLVTYNIYDAVYDVDFKVYRSKVNSNTGNLLTDTAYWELIEAPSVLGNNKGEANESLNIESIIYQRVLTANSQYGYANYLSTKSCCSDCDKNVILQNYTLLDFLVQSAIVDDYRSELPEGEIICRKIEAILATC